MSRHQRKVAGIKSKNRRIRGGDAAKKTLEIREVRAAWEVATKKAADIEISALMSAPKLDLTDSARAEMLKENAAKLALKEQPKTSVLSGKGVQFADATNAKENSQPNYLIS